MKKYVYTQTVSEEVENVTCNMCGKLIEKNAYGYPEDFVSIEKRWGYHSPYDGETHKIDVCICCYTKLSDMLKIPPEKN